MKGIVFTEFLDMVEDRFDANTVDDIIEASGVPSKGVYTAVGTYPHEEIVALVVALSAQTQTPAPALIRAFGEYLFGRFVVAYPSFFANVKGIFDFLTGIEDIIHAEVQKLYPDAELPRFDVCRDSPTQLTLVYHSKRHFEDLAEGLLTGAIAHFGEPISSRRESSGPEGERFILVDQRG